MRIICNMIRYGITLTLALLMSGMLQAQEKQWLFLYGSREGGSINLYWDVFAWPADLEGFMLKRRMLTEDGFAEWTGLNTQAFSPDVELAEDWANQGLDAVQAVQLDSALARSLRGGLLSPASRNEMLEMLQSNNGLGSGDRIRMKGDFNLALILDFAYVDNSALVGIDYEYALFPVIGGVESSLPLSSFSTRLLSAPEYDVRFQKLIQGIAINWQLDRAQYQGRAVLGFYLFRRNPGSNSATRLVESPLGSFKEIESLLAWRFNDLLADSRKSHEYGIAYVDMFQKMSDTVWTLYDAEYFLEPDPPLIDSVLLIDGQHVELRWSLPESSSGKATSFIVELSGDAEPGKWQFVAISDTLGSGINQFTDTLFKQFGNIYFYRVAMLDKFGRLWPSREKSIFYMGAIKPPRISRIEARSEVSEGKALVHLEWDLNRDTITQAYILFSDELHEGTMNELAAIGKLKGPQFTHTIPTAGGRYYTLGIAPLGRYGAVGEVNTVRIYVPVAKMPPLYTIQASLDENLIATIRWDYPELKELKGFELFMNDKPVAGPSQLGPAVREFRIKKIDLKPGSSYVEFRLKAIGEGMETPLSQKQSFYLPNVQLNDIMPPDSFRVELVYDSSNYYALITWKEANLDSLGYSGYILYADYYREGSVQLMSSLPLITGNSYLYKLPDLTRTKYTLRVAALTEKGVRGRYAQASLATDEESIRNARVIDPKTESHD